MATLHDGGQQSAGGRTATVVRPQVEDRPPSRAEVAVRQAAQFTAGALGMVVTAVLLHVLRTLRDVVRR